MRAPLRLTHPWLSALLGAALSALVGLGLLTLNSRPGRALTRASYDWAFDLCWFKSRSLKDSEVVIVYMDEASYRQLGQPFNAPWDRALHARLLQQLETQGARAVIFDILFTDPGPSPEADQAFLEAIRNSGNVILAGDYTPTANKTLDGMVTALMTLTPPYAPFREAAAGWGVAQLQPDDDFIVRQHYHGPLDQNLPGLSWAAAQFLKLPVAQHPENRAVERWVNYYGGPETVPHVSYARVLQRDGVPPGFFRNKVVFVGARPITGSFIERRDELRSSFSTWNERFIFMPAVEVHATLLLNLIRGDWLRRLPPALEWGLLLGAAIGFGAGLTRWRPLPASGLALAGVILWTLGSVVLFGKGRYWYPWLIVVLAQIPVALLFSILVRSVEWYIQRRRLEQERRRAEQRIREQAALLDKAQDAIFVHDLAGRITYWNKSAERLYGWNAQEAAGLNLEETLFKSDAEKCREALNQVQQSGEWAGELKQTNREGKELTVQSRWTLVRDEAGQPTGVLIINTDITDKKLLEAQFLRAQRLESIGVLAGGIAHDLNNVLSPILMGVELLEMTVQDPQAGKILQTIGSSAKRGAGMVKQVLAFARGQSGERTTLQLSHLIREMQKIARETFPKNIQVNCRVNPDLKCISGDATQLHQILLNLCVNARDAMPNGGEILIKAENKTLDEGEARRFLNAAPGDYVVVSVSDTGTGIPPEILDKIFEPFFTTKEVGKGTGLGLSTVMGIVKNHHGFLDVQSIVGQGTTFSIYLPATEAKDTGGTTQLPREALEGRGRGVLLVDDEEGIRQVLAESLRQHGYEVITAAHGAEALTLCSHQKETIDAAVVDMMMPVLDGPKTIAQLRALKPQIPIVAVSGMPQPEETMEELKRLRVAFMPKPFRLEKLLEHLRPAA